MSGGRGRPRRRPRTRANPVLAAAVALTAVGLGPEASTAQEALVKIELPEPWGPHAVGVRTLMVHDSARADTISADPDDHRPVLVRLWYPAEPSDRDPRPYMDSRVADAWRGTLPAPDGFEAEVHTHAVPDATVADARERWPVLLFSPGRSFPVENYQLSLEHLASLGWVVAAISPPYEEVLTVLPDGRELPFAGPTWESEEGRGEVLSSVVDDLVLDASVVLDRLASVAAGDGPLAGRLDLERGVGYFGHSLGGAVAARTLERDARVRAAASWEGQVYREAERPLRVGGPLLYLVGGANRDELVGTHYRPARDGGAVYEVVIRGAWHPSFGDLLWIYRRYADRAWLERHRRELPAARVNQITNDLLHEFFAHHLLDGGLDLLWPDSSEESGSYETWNYPEVELRVYAGAGR